MVGGGQDGERLAAAFAEATFPPGMLRLLLMGPYMDAGSRERLRRQSAANDSFKAVDFVTEPAELLRAVDRVVAMGEYNTVYEMLSFHKQGLIVPRTAPRREQLIRAERLSELGLLDLLHPAELSSAAISQWLAKDLGTPPRARDRIDWNGLFRLPKLLDDVLAGVTGGSALQSATKAVTYAAV